MSSELKPGDEVVFKRRIRDGVVEHIATLTVASIDKHSVTFYEPVPDTLGFGDYAFRKGERK